MTTAPSIQAELFEPPRPIPIPGLRYQTEFLSSAQERSLIQVLQSLPLKEAQYRQWRANRRMVSYGGTYDFSAHELLPADPVPPFLFPLRERIAAWVGLSASDFNHALIAEYRPDTQLGWHRDVPNFGSVVGVSLAGAARMRFRPYPPVLGQRKAVFALALEPRSIYAMQNAARWQWQHAVSPTKMLRYSITFRTLADTNTRATARAAG
jgi:alkylated DNA repair dioxygenase AlkB